jgi:hypothetical protein
MAVIFSMPVTHCGREVGTATIDENGRAHATLDDNLLADFEVRHICKTRRFHSVRLKYSDGSFVNLDQEVKNAELTAKAKSVSIKLTGVDYITRPLLELMSHPDFSKEAMHTMAHISGMNNDQLEKLYQMGVK